MKVDGEGCRRSDDHMIAACSTVRKLQAAARGDTNYTRSCATFVHDLTKQVNLTLTIRCLKSALAHTD